MKKLLITIFIIVSMLLSIRAFALPPSPMWYNSMFVNGIRTDVVPHVWFCYALTGGATGALDNIPISLISNDDIAIAVVSDVTYSYQFNSTDTGAEASPTKIRPDDYTTAGTWILSSMNDGGPSSTRDISTLNMTNGDTQTTITEAQLLANKYITNQGDTVETDIKLVAVSYYISVVFIVSENLIMEVCPPTGELFDFDGTSLDANDCVDMDATVGSKMVATRMLLADGSTWRWSLDTVRGVHTDTGATD